MVLPSFRAIFPAQGSSLWFGTLSVWTFFVMSVNHVVDLAISHPTPSSPGLWLLSRRERPTPASAATAPSSPAPPDPAQSRDISANGNYTQRISISKRGKATPSPPHRIPPRGTPHLKTRTPTNGKKKCKQTSNADSPAPGPGTRPRTGGPRGPAPRPTSASRRGRGTSGGSTRRAW